MIVDVKRCDRCGSIYEYKDGSFLLVEAHTHDASRWCGMPVKKKDICPACKIAFEEWMKPKEE